MLCLPDHLAGAREFDTLAEDRKQFFLRVSSQLAEGQVLLNDDVTYILRETSQTPRVAATKQRAIGLVSTERSADIFAYLNVMLWKGHYGKKSLATFHDLQLRPEETDIRKLSDYLAGTLLGRKLGTVEPVHTEAWIAAADQAHRDYRALLFAEQA